MWMFGEKNENMPHLTTYSYFLNIWYSVVFEECVFRVFFFKPYLVLLCIYLCYMILLNT